MEIQNRKARHDYFILNTTSCGIVLKGNEVKSIRAGSANLNEAWCNIVDGQLILHNMYIAKYDTSNKFDVSERRDRVLLANKHEIQKMTKFCIDAGNTLVPLRIYTDRQYIKIDIGMCKGKHNYDKREALKQKAINKAIREHHT